MRHPLSLFQAEGSARPSVVSRALEGQEAYETVVLEKAAMQMVTGGADTVRNLHSEYVFIVSIRPDCFCSKHVYIGHAPAPSGTRRGTSGDRQGCRF